MQRAFRSSSEGHTRQPTRDNGATQLTDFGTDQSPMMTVHSAKIRTRWKNATTAKISPATKENVFLSMANHLNGWRTLGGIKT
jgi:hypothetical protein